MLKKILWTVFLFYPIEFLGMVQVSNFNKDSLKQIVESTMMLRMRQEIVDSICFEQSYLRYDLVLEMYDYFWKKLDQKCSKDSVFFKSFAEEFNVMMKNHVGNRVNDTFYHPEKYPIIDKFFSLFFESSTLCIVLSRDFQSQSIAASRLIKAIEDQNIKRLDAGHGDIIDLDKESRDVFMGLVYRDISVGSQERLACQGQAKKAQKKLRDQERLLAIAEKKLREDEQRLEGLKKDSENLFKFLCNKYNISKKSERTQEEAFVLMQNGLLDQEEQGRNAIARSQQDRFKNRVAIIYESLYAKNIEEEFQRSAKEKQEVLQDVLLAQHIDLQKKLMLQMDFLREKVKCFAKLVLEPNAKALETSRFKKEQRPSCDTTLTQEMSLDNVVVSFETDFDISQDQNALEKIQKAKDVLRHARMQKRSVKAERNDSVVDSASKHCAIKLFKRELKNKNARYAVGIKEASCQTENVEKCLCSHKQMQFFSYDAWFEVAMNAKCPCISCCGFRKVLHDSDLGDVKAQQVKQNLSLNPIHALSFYKEFSFMSKNFSSF